MDERRRSVTALEARELGPALGAEVNGIDLREPLDDATSAQLQQLFDRRGVLVFRDVDLAHADQLRLCETLIRKPGGGEGVAPIEDTFYISNKRPRSAAPFGRLQFHSDTMWCDEGFEALSLYGVDVEPPVVPTTFVSATYAWATLSDDLRTRVRGLRAVHTAGEVRRGDMTDVLLSSVEQPPSTVMPIARPHPRTGDTILYVCEQMTQHVVGLDDTASEDLLEQLFAHLYDPATCWNHEWRARDLVVWDNLAVQHARPNVLADGPVRTLRKVATPMPKLRPDQRPSYRASE
jgi:alpha-ketoglutarate-dependent taurine dioxygenase